MKSRRRTVIWTFAVALALGLLVLLLSSSLYHQCLDHKRYLDYRENKGKYSIRILTTNGIRPQKHRNVTIFQVNADPPKVLQAHGNTNITVEEGIGNQCKPSTHIVFLKTHKTGSSTMASIFQRFGFARNLSFVVPRSGSLISRRLFRRSYASPGTYDMLVNHVRYNRKEMDAVMKPGTKYITILRDPAAQAESVFGYFQLFRPLNLSEDANPFEKFISRPQYYMEQYPMFQTRNHLKNPSLYDLGGNPYQQSNLKIQSYIDTISREFDLVLLQEYFNESLLLLKKLLCWDLDDILYIIKKLRINSSRHQLSASLKIKSREWNSADVKLYDFFNATFWKKVSDYGPGFKTDLKIFEVRLNATFYECTIPDKKRNVDQRTYTFKMNPESGTTCKHMLLDVEQFTDTIRMSQTYSVKSVKNYT